MLVKELIRKLQQFPADAQVVMGQELGIGEVGEISFEELWLCDFGRYTAWSMPVEYPRNIVKKEKMVVIFE